MSDLNEKKKNNDEQNLLHYVIELKLNKDLNQKADKENSDIYKLNFDGVDTRHIVNKQSKILEIYSHNDDQRVTIVTQCLNIFTFVK